MIALIAACDRNGVIGYNGKIPWNIKGEQKRFKAFTGDTFFPKINIEEWVKTYEMRMEGEIPYTYITLDRKLINQSTSQCVHW